MRTGLRGIVLALALAPAVGLAQEAAEEPAMTWPEATELLQRERDSGVACAKVVKRLLPEGDMAALSQTELDYEAARSAFNGAIAGLQAALVDDKETPTLAAVTTSLDAGSAAREALCDLAEAELAQAKPGEKGGIGEAVAAAVGELIKGGTAIWQMLGEKDALRRANLNTALEDAKWPAFADIET